MAGKLTQQRYQIARNPDSVGLRRQISECAVKVQEKCGAEAGKDR